MAPSVGKRLDQFVELVDLHATLADLAAIPPTPPTQLPASVAAKQSRSFAHLFANPAAAFKNASFSQWPVCTKVANRSCMACTGPLSSRARIDSMVRCMPTASVLLLCPALQTFAWLMTETETHRGKFGRADAAARSGR